MRLSLEEKYLEYLLNFETEEKDLIKYIDDLGEISEEMRDYVDKTYEGGKISREAIKCIAHSNETVLTKITEESPRGKEEVPRIVIEYNNGSPFTFTCTTIEEQMSIYKQLIDWKWN